MNSRAPASGPSALAGATIGAAAWLTLAAIEYALWLLALRFSRSYCSDASLAWNRDLILFALYPVVGAGVGVIGALVCRWSPWRSRLLGAGRANALVRVLSLIGFALVTSAGVLVQIELRGLGRAMFVAPLVVGAGLFLAALSGGRGYRPVPGTNAWIVGAVLLGVPWAATQAGLHVDPRIPIYGCALLFFCYVVVIVFLRWKSGPVVSTSEAWPSRPPTTGRPLIKGLAAAAAVASMAVWLDLRAYLPAAESRRAAADATHPNVILIVLDTARAQNFTLYGYGRNTTPNISRFAREGEVFTHAISASNYTLSSHASLFTGLATTTHGAHPMDPEERRRGVRGEAGLASRFDTLAEILTRRGYFTAAVMSNYLFLSQSYNLDQGFQRFTILSYRCAAPSPRPFFRTLLLRLNGRSADSASRTPYHNAAQVNEDAFDLLGRLARRKQRFFLFLNYMDVHFPYAPPPPYDTLFPGKGTSIDRDAYFDLRNGVLDGSRQVSETERRHLLSQYDGALAYLDGEIARLLGELKRLDAYDRSFIIITADHGEAFGEKGYIEHGSSTYQDQIHVPLIVRYPGGGPPAIIDRYVSGVDILPTVLDVLGEKSPPGIQGWSLRAHEGAPRTILSESYPREAFQHFGPRFQRVERAIFDGPLKVITSARGGAEMYDLRTDPAETQNLFGKDRPEGAALLGKLDAWLAASERPGGAPVTDPETLERLRSLGYIK